MFLATTPASGFVLVLCSTLGITSGHAHAQVALNPGDIPKYVHSLVVPPTMPKTAEFVMPGVGHVDYYEIGVRQLEQQVLPPGFPATQVWGYGSVNHPETFNYPGFTIEARWKRLVRVKWINELVDADGNYLPHLLPVDPTLHWANPPGGVEGRDSTPTFDETPGPYTGPVPIVTHLHGGLSAQDSDGFTEAWYLPDANDIPSHYAAVGSLYDTFRAESEAQWGASWTPGSAVFHYLNRQPAATLWYHDHALGITRVNVYAGLAGFYLLRGGPNDVSPNRVPSGPYEIPLAVQDRSFNEDGSLRYPESREDFDGFEGPYVPESDIAPIWNPEFFGETIVVNGRTWPAFTAEARRYRFRLLNGSDSRFLILKIVTDPLVERPADAALPWHQIGTDVGLLRSPVARDDVLLGPGERADVIVDFTDVPPGMSLYVINEGPDEPFGEGIPGIDFPPADPTTTGQVMRFDIVAPTGVDKTARMGRLRLPAPPAVAPGTIVRRVALLEVDSEVLPGVGPRMALLGTVDENGEVTEHRWEDVVTEVVQAGTTEIWEIHNFTEDAHPIHLHAVGFNVVDREDLEVGLMRSVPEWEAGLKDTVIAFPEEITTIRATFDQPGLFVWHCHILSHEDHEMMRPISVER